MPVTRTQAKKALEATTRQTRSQARATGGAPAGSTNFTSSPQAPLKKATAKKGASGPSPKAKTRKREDEVPAVAAKRARAAPATAAPTRKSNNRKAAYADANTQPAKSTRTKQAKFETSETPTVVGDDRDEAHESIEDSDNEAVPAPVESLPSEEFNRKEDLARSLMSPPPRPAVKTEQVGHNETQDAEDMDFIRSSAPSPDPARGLSKATSAIKQEAVSDIEQQSVPTAVYALPEADQNGTDDKQERHALSDVSNAQEVPAEAPTNGDQSIQQSPSGSVQDQLQGELNATASSKAQAEEADPPAKRCFEDEETPANKDTDSSPSPPPVSGPVSLTLPTDGKPCDFLEQSLGHWREMYAQQELSSPVVSGVWLTTSHVFRAINAVAEAIRNQHGVEFALIDDATAQALRAGTPISSTNLFQSALGESYEHQMLGQRRDWFLPWHYERRPSTAGVSGVGKPEKGYAAHHFLVHIRLDAQNQVTVKIYDSKPAHLEAMRPQLIEHVRRAIQMSEWLGSDGDTAQTVIPDAAFDWEPVATQHDSTNCGDFVIFNSWIRMLGLTPTDAVPQNQAIWRIAAEVINMAINGTIDSATIHAFLACYGFVQRGTAIPTNRVFDRTFAFRTDLDLFDHEVVRAAEARSMQPGKFPALAPEIPAAAPASQPPILQAPTPPTPSGRTAEAIKSPVSSEDLPAEEVGEPPAENASEKSSGDQPGTPRDRSGLPTAAELAECPEESSEFEDETEGEVDGKPIDIFAAPGTNTATASNNDNGTFPGTALGTTPRNGPETDAGDDNAAGRAPGEEGMPKLTKRDPGGLPRGSNNSGNEMLGAEDFMDSLSDFDDSDFNCEGIETDGSQENEEEIDNATDAPNQEQAGLQQDAGLQEVYGSLFDEAFGSETLTGHEKDTADETAPVPEDSSVGKAHPTQTTLPADNLADTVEDLFDEGSFADEEDTATGHRSARGIPEILVEESSSIGSATQKAQEAEEDQEDLLIQNGTQVARWMALV